MKKNAWWTLGRNVVSVLLAALLAVPAGLAGEVSAVVPADLEGVILESVPAEWGDLVSPVPTEVPGLYVVVAQPYLAMDPRANEFRARWDGQEVDPTDPQAVAEMLADPALEGATVLVFSLWRQVDGRGSLLGFREVSISEGAYVAETPVILDDAEFGDAIVAWRAALLERIREDRQIREETFAAEVAWYTLLARDRTVLRLWTDHLGGGAGSCDSRSLGSSDDCKECCTDDFRLERLACYFAGALAASGTCMVSLACGPLAEACCHFGAAFAAGFVGGECLTNVGLQVDRCTKNCRKSFEVKKP